MTNSDIFEKIEEFAPKSLACEWDNPGLMMGSGSDLLRGIVFCLDVTDAVVEEAVSKGANLIVSHHPLIFRGVKTLDLDTSFGKLTEKILRHGITVYSAHTNLDFSVNGTNIAILKDVGCQDPRLTEDGMHFYAKLPKPRRLDEICGLLEAKYGIHGKWVLPEGKSRTDICRKIGVFTGSFDGETGWFSSSEIDLLITGELHHHDALALKEGNVPVLALGHYGSEIPGVIRLCETVSYFVKEKGGKLNYLGVFSETDPFEEEA